MVLINALKSQTKMLNVDMKTSQRPKRRCKRLRSLHAELLSCIPPLEVMCV